MEFPEKQTDFVNPQGVNEEMGKDSEDDKKTMRITENNFQQVLEFVNERLKIFEVTEKGISFSATNKTENYHIVQCFYDILRLKERDIERIDVLSNQISKINSDNETYRYNIKKRTEKLRKVEITLEQQKMKFRTNEKSASDAYKKLERKHKESLLQNKNLKQKHVQLNHKNSRLEREVQKHKEKLTKMLSSSNYQKQRIEKLNAFPSENKARIWKHGRERNENKMYQDIVAAFEDDKKEIVEENVELKDSIRAISEQLGHIRNIAYARKNVTNYETSVEDIKDGQYGVPFQLSRDVIEETLKEKIEEIRKVLDSFDVDENGKEDLVEKFNDLNKVLIEFVNDEDQFEIAQSILNTFNQRVFYLQDLLSQQNKLLEIDYSELRKRSTLGIQSYFEEENKVLEQRRKEMEDHQEELKREALEISQKQIERGLSLDDV